MSKNILTVVGITILFLGVGFQPVINADVSINYDNSELVEIIVEIYEVNRVQEYTVMLTQEQAEKLELLINYTKTELDTADNSGETENIFMNTVLSLNELGLLPNIISVEEAQRIVKGEEQNPRIVKFLEREYSKNQKSLDDENTLCLIAGDTINTIFAGSIPILILLRSFIFTAIKLNIFFDWLSNFPKLWEQLMRHFEDIFNIFFGPRLSFWLFLAAGINFLPIKFGALIYYGWYDISFDPHHPSERIPAKGWINTNGLSGKKEWIGNFYGNVIGFTGIKIIRGFLNFYYLGAALKVRMKDA